MTARRRPGEPTPAEGPRWLELSVEAGVEAVEAVSEILGRVSAGTAVCPTRLVRDPRDELRAAVDTAAPFEVIAHLSADADSERAVDATRRALWHLQAFGLGPVGDLRVRAVDGEGWTDGWRAHYVPLRIGRVVVVPSWRDEPLADDEVAVVLDPGMAFGTGLHPTTRACLELLQRLGPLPHAVLDVGSGSGILGIAALRLGAGRVVALDTDPDAVAATSENATRNGVADRLAVRRGTVGPVADERYGLVLANLVAAVLIELAAPLAAHLEPGGTLLVGGIIAPRRDEVVEAFAAAGVRVTDELADGEWVTLALRHASAA